MIHCMELWSAENRPFSHESSRMEFIIMKQRTWFADLIHAKGLKPARRLPQLTSGMVDRLNRQIISILVNAVSSHQVGWKFSQLDYQAIIVSLPYWWGIKRRARHVFEEFHYGNQPLPTGILIRARSPDQQEAGGTAQRRNGGWEWGLEKVDILVQLAFDIPAIAEPGYIRGLILTGWIHAKSANPGSGATTNYDPHFFPANLTDYVYWDPKPGRKDKTCQRIKLYRINYQFWSSMQLTRRLFGDPGSVCPTGIIITMRHILLVKPSQRAAYSSS